MGDWRPEEIDALLRGFELDAMGLGPVPRRDERRPRVASLIADLWFEQSVGYWRSHPGDDWRHA